MKESELYGPLRNWLVAHGYEIHVELFGHDVIAIKDGLFTVVELKTCLTETLCTQLRDAARWADFACAAIASEPRSTRLFKYCGFGLFQIDVTRGRVRQRLRPKPQPFEWHKARKYRLGKLAGRLPAQDHELAGLPCCPALRSQRAMRESINQPTKPG